MEVSKFFLFTQAGPIGKRRTLAHGRFPRENTKPETTQSPLRKENLKRKPDSRRQPASRNHSLKSDSAPGRLSPPGLSEETAMPRQSAATYFRWSGPQNPERSRNFRRLTALRGSLWLLRTKKSMPRRETSSTAWRRASVKRITVIPRVTFDRMMSCIEVRAFPGLKSETWGTHFPAIRAVSESPRSNLRRVGQRIGQHSHDCRILVEVLRVDLVERVGGCVVVVEVKSTVLHRRKTRHAFRG